LRAGLSGLAHFNCAQPQCRIICQYYGSSATFSQSPMGKRGISADYHGKQKSESAAQEAAH
jgi:hypothetical protein